MMWHFDLKVNCAKAGLEGAAVDENGPAARQLLLKGSV